MVGRLSQYVRESFQEMKRVSWPNVAELRESTIVVLVTVSLITVLLYVVDYLLKEGMERLIRLF